MIERAKLIKQSLMIAKDSGLVGTSFQNGQPLIQSTSLDSRISEQPSPVRNNTIMQQSISNKLLRPVPIRGDEVNVE